MLPKDISARCEEILGAPVRNISAVGGGDINEAAILHTDTNRYFIKYNRSPDSLQMFRTEAAGLRLIRDTHVIRCPAVLACEHTGGVSFLLQEFVESGPKTASFWKQFGAALAAMHQKKQPHYGLPFDNFIGSLPQANPSMTDWPAFYRLARLQPQLDLAVQDRKLNAEDLRQFEQLFLKIPDILPNERPSLIHGDLWSGNFLAAANGEGVLIDPAVCFGHREMDIAMSRLFGGFAPAFYEAYQAAYPLLPDWSERLPLYQLYYLLVHVNLFGGSYVQSVRHIVRRFI